MPIYRFIPDKANKWIIRDCRNREAFRLSEKQAPT